MNIAFVFPGQGSQAVGMGRDLYEASPAARAVFDQADEILRFALTHLCFAGPEATLIATEHAQPALLTVSTALLAALAEGTGVKESCGYWAGDSTIAPAFVAGHSLGEYSALVAAGALSFPTALRLVRRRGELMAEADEGAMAAIIGMDEALLEAICREASSEGAPVVIANYNAPGQLVISGAAAAVERAVGLAKTRGARRTLPLKVSAAFHSPLMRAAAEGLAEAIHAAPIVDAQVPVVSNVLAQPLSAVAAIRHELAEQVMAPVRWIASVRHMVDAGVDTFVEIGPGMVLTGLIKRIAPGVRLVNVSDLAGVRAFMSYEL
ncbi:MAG: ACP S-malonyltransferase [Roseiflexaceae bacterium]